MSKGTALPEDWAPTNQDRDYGRCVLHLTDRQIEGLAEDMRLWAGANSNRQVARKANWSMAFKGWMRREAAKRKPPERHGLATLSEVSEYLAGDRDGDLFR